MHERTGEQTSIGAINIAFGVMGLVLTALLFIFGPHIEADMHTLGANAAMIGLANKMPTTDALSLDLELARAVVWIALIIAGMQVLRLTRSGKGVNLMCGAALIIVNSMKLVDGGMNFIDLGLACYGVALVTYFLRADWSAVTAVSVHIVPTMSPSQATTDEARQAA